MMDLKMRCLDTRLEQVDSLASIFEQADAAVVEKSVQAVAQLPDLARCDDDDFLLAAVPPPEDADVARQVDDARAQIARMRAMIGAGKYPDALERAESLASKAGTLDYDPLEAEVRYWLGVSQIRTGDLDGAASSLEEGYWRSLASGHESVAVDAATELVYVIGYRKAEHGPGLSWSKHARALEERVEPEYSDPGRLDNNVASLNLSSGDISVAERFQTDALTERRRELGERHPEVANALLNLGNIQMAAAKYDDAEASYAAAREVYLDLLGPNHPVLGTVETSIGNLESTRGNYESSREHFEAAIEIVTTALGPEHTRVGNAWLGLGYALSAAQDHPGAEEAMRRSLAIKRAAHGDMHPEVATAWSGLADQLQTMGKLEESHDAKKRAFEISLKLYGEDNVNLAAPMFNLGEIERVLGQFDSAKQRFEQALQLWTTAYGEDHPDRSYALDALGRIADAEGDADEAVSLLEEALALRVKHFETDSYYVTRTRFALATALTNQGASAQRPRAVELAKKARSGFETYGDTELVKDVDAWLREHSLPAAPASD